MQWIRVTDDLVVFASYLVMFGMINHALRPPRRFVWTLGAAVYVHAFTWLVRHIDLFDKWYAVPVHLVLVFVPLFVLYPKERIWRLLYVEAAINVSSIAAAVLASLLVSMISGKPMLQMGGAEDFQMLIVHVLEVSMHILLFYAMMLPISRHSTHGLNWMGYLLFITSQCILLFVSLLFVANAPTTSMAHLYILGVCTLLCVVADLALLRTIQRNLRAVQAEGENAALRELQQVQMHYNLELQDQLRRTATMRHDMINHLHTLKILLEEDKDRAKDYLSELIAGAPNVSETVFCGNAPLNALLYGKMMRATDIGAELDIDIHLPTALAFDDVDLVSVVANLLDNALEAVDKLPNDLPSVIHLAIDQSAGFLVIRCENPYAGEVRFDGALPTTTKGEGNGGIGARIIAHIAEKHRGEARFEALPGLFRTSVALLIEAAPAVESAAEM